MCSGSTTRRSSRAHGGTRGGGNEGYVAQAVSGTEEDALYGRGVIPAYRHQHNARQPGTPSGRGVDYQRLVHCSASGHGGTHPLTRGRNVDHQIYMASDSRLGVYDTAGGSGFRPCGYTMTNLSAGWHPLAAVGTGTTFHLDGVRVGTSDRKSTSGGYAVGNHKNNNQRFSEALDDVRFYLHGLAPEQIATRTAGNNQPPLASIQATPSGGAVPLTVTFNGSGSSDPDGSIVCYSWEFGHHTWAEGPIVTNTFT